MLIAVLVVVGSALLVATFLIHQVQTEAAGAAGAADAAQGRALLWSGAQAVMSGLNDQRHAILTGDSPQLEAQFVIYEIGSRLGTVRLLPLHAGQAPAPVSEAGKLDLNRIDAEGLVRTGLVDPATAAAIIAYREQLGRPFQSVDELLNVPDGSVTGETLYGPLQSISIWDEAVRPQTDVVRRGAARPQSQSPRGLADILTVFSFEPAIQNDGRRRIDLNMTWSDQLQRRVEDRFGADAAVLLKKLFESGATFDHDRKIFQSLRSLKTPVEDWPPIVDAFTTDKNEHHFGRLDLNTAPLEALMALPGITAEQAAQIVNVRQELSAAERATIAWPAIEQIVPPEAYDELAGRITTRCWLWRVRLAAGEVSADEPGAGLSHPIIADLVIDLSDPTPRIAYWREVTLLQEMARLSGRADVAGFDEFGQMDEAASTPAPIPVFVPDLADDGEAGANPPAAAPPSPRKLGRWRRGD